MKMFENIQLKDIYVMEILSLACSLVRSIDQYNTVRVRYGAGPTPISDARSSALTVASMAALEFIDDGSIQDEDELFRDSQSLLGALGVEIE